MDAKPIPLQMDYTAYGIRWRRGDTFRFRLYLALKLIDSTAARIYFQTTV